MAYQIKRKNWLKQSKPKLDFSFMAELMVIDQARKSNFTFIAQHMMRPRGKRRTPATNARGGKWSSIFNKYSSNAKFVFEWMRIRLWMEPYFQHIYLWLSNIIGPLYSTHIIISMADLITTVSAAGAEETML